MDRWLKCSTGLLAGLVFAGAVQAVQPATASHPTVAAQNTRAVGSSAAAAIEGTSPSTPAAPSTALTWNQFLQTVPDSDKDRSSLVAGSYRYSALLARHGDADLETLQALGLPLPEQWMQARQQTDDALRQLAETGDPVAQALYVDRMLLKAMFADQLLQTSADAARRGDTTLAMKPADLQVEQERRERFSAQAWPYADRLLQQRPSAFAAHQYGQAAALRQHSNNVLVASRQLARDLGDNLDPTQHPIERGIADNPAAVMLSYRAMRAHAGLPSTQVAATTAPSRPAGAGQGRLPLFGGAVESNARSWDAFLKTVDEEKRGYLRALSGRYHGVLEFADMEQRQRNRALGVPLPEEWLQARRLDDAELKRLADNGDVTAKKVRLDRLVQLLEQARLQAGAPTVHALISTTGDRSVFIEPLVAVSVTGSDLLRNDQSAFAALMYGTTQGTVHGYEMERVAALALADDLGETRALQQLQRMAAEPASSAGSDGVFVSYARLRSTMGFALPPPPRMAAGD